MVLGNIGFGANPLRVGLIQALGATSTSMQPSPPKCRRYSDADLLLFDRYQNFLHEAFGTGSHSADWHHLARALASDLQAESAKLGMSRVHEHSPDIYWLTQCAAVVSLLSFGPMSSDFQKYKSAVHYYNAFPGTSSMVLEFDGYVQDHIDWLLRSGA